MVFFNTCQSLQRISLFITLNYMVVYLYNICWQILKFRRFIWNMNIQILPNTNYISSKPIAFKQNIQIYNKDNNYGDNFLYQNIKAIKKNKNNHLKSIDFKYPITVSEALYNLSKTNSEYISYEMLRKLHTTEQLYDMSETLKNTNNIGDIKVKSLAGIGTYALAFEMEDEKILKLTDIEHFANGRKPADFDLPIIKSGKTMGYRPYYYYIEEKVTQHDITQKEIRTLVGHIKQLGYEMTDHLIYGEDGSPNAIYKIEQFGRTKDGKVYLIDPRCVIETKDVLHSAKKNLLKSIFRIIFK